MVHHCPKTDSAVGENYNRAPQTSRGVSKELVTRASSDGALVHYCLTTDLAMGRNSNNAPRY